MKICIFSLGCKVNQYESDSIAKALRAKGHEVTECLEPADLYILNTCAVTAEAERKSRQLVARVKKLNVDAKIFVSGCASQHSAKPFVQKGVTYVSGVADRKRLMECIDELQGVCVTTVSKVYEDLYVSGVGRVSKHIREYIKIQDGCNRFCSYCIIPFLRGRSRSRSEDSILDEINNSSAPEIVLTGIDLSDYNGKGGLTKLLLSLATTNKRIRLGSLEMSIIDNEFLSACRAIGNFCPHFHLSLQSGADKVLKDMNRHYTTQEFLSKVELIRTVFPQAAITTDIIVGYPTETDEDFANTLEFVKTVKFADIHIFPFSAREGTKAYKLTPQLPATVAKRVQALTDLKKALIKEFHKLNLGSINKILIESCENENSEGYSENYIRTYIKGGSVGEILTVKNKKIYKDGLFAQKE